MCTKKTSDSPCTLSHPAHVQQRYKFTSSLSQRNNGFHIGDVATKSLARMSNCWSRPITVSSIKTNVKLLIKNTMFD